MTNLRRSASVDANIFHAAWTPPSAPTQLSYDRWDTTSTWTVRSAGRHDTRRRVLHESSVPAVLMSSCVCTHVRVTAAVKRNIYNTLLLQPTRGRHRLNSSSSSSSSSSQLAGVSSRDQHAARGERSTATSTSRAQQQCASQSIDVANAIDRFIIPSYSAMCSSRPTSRHEWVVHHVYHTVQSSSVCSIIICCNCSQKFNTQHIG